MAENGKWIEGRAMVVAMAFELRWQWVARKGACHNCHIPTNSGLRRKNAKSVATCGCDNPTHSTCDHDTVIQDLRACAPATHNSTSRGLVLVHGCTPGNNLGLLSRSAVAVRWHQRGGISGVGHTDDVEVDRLPPPLRIAFDFGASLCTLTSFSV